MKFDNNKQINIDINKSIYIQTNCDFEYEIFLKFLLNYPKIYKKFVTGVPGRYHRSKIYHYIFIKESYLSRSQASLLDIEKEESYLFGINDLKGLEHVFKRLEDAFR